MAIEFFVPGIPAPGGSKRVFINPKTNKPIVTDDAGQRNKEWKNQVKCISAEAMIVFNQPIFEGALRVNMTFVMPRPKGHFGTGKRAGILRSSAPKYPTVKPDRIKLARATEDAMTGIVWRDDAQTVSGNIEKIYGDQPGAKICIHSVTNKEQP